MVFQSPSRETVCLPRTFTICGEGASSLAYAAKDSSSTEMIVMILFIPVQDIMEKRYPWNIRGYLSIYQSILESELLEEVVTLVVHKDECREVLYADLPDSLHTEFRILYALDALDIVLSKDSCRTTD